MTTVRMLKALRKIVYELNCSNFGSPIRKMSEMAKTMVQRKSLRIRMIQPKAHKEDII